LWDGHTRSCLRYYERKANKNGVERERTRQMRGGYSMRLWMPLSSWERFGFVTFQSGRNCLLDCERNYFCPGQERVGKGLVPSEPFCDEKRFRTVGNGDNGFIWPMVKALWAAWARYLHGRDLGVTALIPREGIGRMACLCA
jgi:hypothetical protein